MFNTNRNNMTKEQPICVINNPESVIEVFIDSKTKTVLERKRLNYNRYKTYSYPLNEYLERYKHNTSVYNSVMAAVN